MPTNSANDLNVTDQISIRSTRNTECLLGYNNEAAPHQGAAFVFLLFARQARVPILYVPFDFFLAFFFMTLFLSVGPLSQSEQWQQADERGVNRSWQRGISVTFQT
jgi:hypothetical protein